MQRSIDLKPPRTIFYWQIDKNEGIGENRFSIMHPYSWLWNLGSASIRLLGTLLTEAFSAQRPYKEVKRILHKMRSSLQVIVWAVTDLAGATVTTCWKLVGSLHGHHFSNMFRKAILVRSCFFPTFPKSVPKVFPTFPNVHNLSVVTMIMTCCWLPKTFQMFSRVLTNGDLGK